MNYKHNLNYFKTGDGLKNLGLAMAIVGGMFYYFALGYVSYSLSCIAIPVGLFLFIWRSVRRSTDKDIDEDVAEQCQGVEIDLKENKQLAARRLKGIEPVVLQGYEYGESDLLRKGKDGSLRSSRYTVAQLIALEDALLVSFKQFSLISDEQQTEKREIPYSALTELKVTEEEKRLPYEKTALRITEHRLLIGDAEGGALSFPMNNDLSVEQFVERLNLSLVKKDAES